MIGTILWLAALGVAGAVVWQHLRYLRIRRSIVFDRQPLLYPPSSFHVATLLALGSAADLLAQIRQLVATLEGDGGAVVVYAGKALSVPAQSSQLAEASWDAVVVAQYRSREHYDAVTGSGAYKEAFSTFAQTYSLGMRRSQALNLAVPIALLGIRFRDILTRRPARFPFTRAAESVLADAVRGRAAEKIQQIRSEKAIGRDAVAVVNFMKSGDADQRAANRGYGLEMLGLMAEQGHGPMHMARAVQVEGGAAFDSVAIVFYPGVEYFADMVQSDFFQGIAAGKQLGDTQVVITAPLLGRLGRL